VSSLWTPGGEHQVPREEPGDQSGDQSPGDGAPPSLEEELAKLSPEEREQAEAMLADMAEAQQRLAEAPVEGVVANHAIGLYQLAAIHLGQQPPHLDAAKLAIDGMRALLEGLQGRLGEHEPELRGALQQIQLAYVQVKEQADG
jgi:hypothetical protein